MEAGSQREQKFQPAETSTGDDEMVALSAHAASALSAFLLERQAAEEASAADPFAENWGLSQFWYTEDTASTVAKEVVDAAGGGGRIACIACPSLFRQLRREFPKAHAHLLEYDPRFEVLGDFTLYDYNHPTRLPDELRSAFAVVVADPPYLSEECLVKTAVTMKFLALDAFSPRYYLLTGAVMRELAHKLLRARPVAFRPEHKNKLGNEFLLYTTVEPTGRLGGWDAELAPQAGAGAS
ncbi:hypothetical protein WJX72_001488 [[Myrmecia] bisecta]|uniref:Protein-lysine N-methyltransferase WJX72_001488 n=1 Tax=[Myrmecia] bisecta TaxID=41462 RepID=A0AAW1R5Y1_9CHLO